MTRINIDINHTLGRIKPMHGVGQPPIEGISTKMFHYLKEANIPYSRLHDVGGWFGGNLFVDIPNVFRDFHADENDPASYDFAFTDIIITDLIKNGCEPVYRLGVSIENFHHIKAYRIFPPADMAKWARICEHIIRHYNEGWANGFHYNIQYWEIWNEPDGHPDIEENAMWKGTKEEYFELYRITSLHLRKCFGNSIKIGGYASCGFYRVKEKQDVSGVAFGVTHALVDWKRRINYFMDFFHEFIAMVKEENLPFDFFSHHSYASPTDNVKMQTYCENYLADAGLGHVEIHLNEWNTNATVEQRGTSIACADSVAIMCAMQNTRMTMMCYYDARVRGSLYAGMFNSLTKEPYCTYYGFKAFGKLYELGTQIECTCDNDQVYAIAAINAEKGAVLLANRGADTTVEFQFDQRFQAYLIDENHHFSLMDIHDNCFKVKKSQVVYIEFLRG